MTALERIKQVYQTFFLNLQPEVLDYTAWGKMIQAAEQVIDELVAEHESLTALVRGLESDRMTCPACDERTMLREEVASLTKQIEETWRPESDRQQSAIDILRAQLTNVTDYACSLEQGKRNALANLGELQSKLEEREADMHMRIRAGYDKTVADSWKAEVKLLKAEIDSWKERLLIEESCCTMRLKKLTDSEEENAKLRGEYISMQEELAHRGEDIETLKQSVMVRDSALEIERERATNLMGTIKALKEDKDKDCICKGNWRDLVAECEPLIGNEYHSAVTNKTYIFFGLVHTEEDYYYGLVTKKGKMILLSCVGDFETHGLYPVEESIH